MYLFQLIYFRFRLNCFYFLLVVTSCEASLCLGASDYLFIFWFSYKVNGDSSSLCFQVKKINKSFIQSINQSINLLATSGGVRHQLHR